MNAEQLRLEEARTNEAAWKKWGPYLSAVHNRGPKTATLQVLPTLWFRNDWSWGEDVARPTLRQVVQNETGGLVAVSHRDLGERFFRRLYSIRAKAKRAGKGETIEKRSLIRVKENLCHAMFLYTLCMTSRQRRELVNEEYPPAMLAKRPK